MIEQSRDKSIKEETNRWWRQGADEGMRKEQTDIRRKRRKINAGYVS